MFLNVILPIKKYRYLDHSMHYLEKLAIVPLLTSLFICWNQNVFQFFSTPWKPALLIKRKLSLLSSHCFEFTPKFSALFQVKLYLNVGPPSFNLSSAINLINRKKFYFVKRFVASENQICKLYTYAMHLLSFPPTSMIGTSHFFLISTVWSS